MNFQERLHYINNFDLQLVGQYSRYAASCNLSSTQLWIYLALFQNEQGLSQKQIAAQFLIPVQTVNTCMKKMKEQGLVEDAPIPGQKRERRFTLTDKGKEAASPIVAPLCQYEENALNTMSEQEQEVLISLLQKYSTSLSSQITESIAKRKGS